jgi:hypothetical protein
MSEVFGVMYSGDGKGSGSADRRNAHKRESKTCLTNFFCLLGTLRSHVRSLRLLLSERLEPTSLDVDGPRIRKVNRR